MEGHTKGQWNEFPALVRTNVDGAISKGMKIYVRSALGNQKWVRRMYILHVIDLQPDQPRQV
jgi:hypothetical protein